MESLLSPVITNFFMEKFEKKGIYAFDFKRTIWLRYVDDTFVIWRDGRDRLKLFLDHMNAQHPSTMETEQEQRIAYLDVLVERRGKRMTHKVYRISTHTDGYLHALSNHNPSQKRGIINTVTERARRICEPEHQQEELEHLQVALGLNGYSVTETKKAMKVKTSTSQDMEETQTVARAFLPDITRVTDRIGNILSCGGIPYNMHLRKSLYRYHQMIHGYKAECQ
ncbi:uncharacterized protein [Leptinotarsa decemlineata]|uniref:uncharacterized protein n=1 Tax=Leptinotarsa decemlineata TaxID=7539 RepID=UPI003D30ADE4